MRYQSQLGEDYGSNPTTMLPANLNMGSFVGTELIYKYNHLISAA